MSVINDGVEYQDDEIDLFQLWQILVEGKFAIALIVVIATLIAVALAFIMTPKYEAKILVMPVQEGKTGGVSALAAQYGGLAEMAGVSLGGASTGKEANLAYLTSRALLESFIKKNNLMPVLYSSLWDEANKKWKVDSPEKIPSDWDSYNLFAKNILSVNSDKKSGLTTVTILWKDRHQAVAWANGLIAIANENLRQVAVNEAKDSLGYLENELRKTSVVEVQQSIFRLTESQVKTMMMANVQEQFAFKVIDPAALMDEDAFVKPKRAMMIGLGLLAGLFFGVIFVFARRALKQRWQRELGN